MSEKEKLKKLCEDELEKRGLSDQFKLRLKNELIEIDVQDTYDYFLNIHENKEKYYNEHNLLVPYLLGICDEFDINQETSYTIGAFPDIDLDFIPAVRDHIKQVWAPETFGKEYVAQVGTYGTYNLKMCLIDMVRIFGKDRNEILNITKQFDVMDDEGKLLTWDKALDLYPALAEFVKNNPEIGEAVKNLTGRNRNIGQHAGGLVISSVPLKDFVPLMGKDYKLETAWTEGQSSQDLSAVGIVKFDHLSVSTLEQIARCINLIKERHGIDKICALPSDVNWSDTSYLNDPKCLEVANKGNLKTCFQFDSEGIRRLVRQGGVTSFDDLVAYASIYRPGPLNCFFWKSKIKVRGGEKIVTEIKNWHDEIAYLNNSGKISYTKKFLISKTGKKKLIKIKTKSGKELLVSGDHRILCKNKEFLMAKNLKIGQKIAISKL